MVLLHPQSPAQIDWHYAFKKIKNLCEKRNNEEKRGKFEFLWLMEKEQKEGEKHDEIYNSFEQLIHVFWMFKY